MIQKSHCYSASWDLNTTQSHTKLQKSMKESLLHEGQFMKNEKCNKKSEKVKRVKEQVRRLRKFEVVRNFAWAGNFKIS